MGAVKHGFPGIHPNPVIRDEQVLPPPQVPAPFPSRCHSASVPYSHKDDSFSSGLLEFPQYTRPAEFRGMKVPDVLLSGHHVNIRRWRMEQSLRKTWERRPDLLENYDFTDEERQILEEIKAEGK